MIKVAVISFAHVHAEGYVRELNARDDVSLIVCDPGANDDPDRGRALAERAGADYVASLDDVVTWSPDAVVVTSENSAHRATVEWGARQGYHVLCEKPLATTLADARAMIEACDRAGVKLMIAYPGRYSPAFCELKMRVQRGELGRVLAAHGSNNGISPVALRPWFGDPELAGGGAIMDHTVHIADLLDVLLDGTPAVDVYAQGNNLLDPGSTKVETAGVVSVRYANDTLATIECGWTHPLAHPIGGGLDLTVVGERGTVEFDKYPALAEGFGTTSAIRIGATTNLDALLIAEFIDSIAEDRTPWSDGRSGLRSLAIVEAAYQSWRSGESVSIAPPIIETSQEFPTPTNTPENGIVVT